MLQRLSQLYQLPAINTDDEDELEKRVGDYFRWCEETETKPSVEGLSLAIGVHRTTIWRWGEGLVGTRRQQQIIQKAKAFITMVWTDLVANQKLHPGAWAFYMKNQAGYRDQVDHVVTTHDPLGDKPDIDKLA